MTPDRPLSFSQRLAAAVAFIAVFTLVLFILTKLPLPVQVRSGNTAYGLAGIILAIILSIIAYRWWRGGTELVFKPDRQTVYRFLMGMIIGASVALAIMWCIGRYAGIKIYRNPAFDAVAFGSGTIAIFLLAWAEELAFRGYPLASLRRGTGPWTSITIVTVCFILYQVVNGWAFQDALVGPGAWALLFSLTALRTGGIAQSTGMHFAGNLIQSLVGTTNFAFFSMSISADPTLTVGDDIRRAGAWTQFALLIISIVLVARYVRQLNRQAVRK